MPLANPYLDLFAALPPGCRRDPAVAPSAAELTAPDWLAFKAAIGRLFAWAVPTEAAIGVIARWAPRGVVEIGAGSGYWAWLLSQAGVPVAAYDLAPPAFTWSPVAAGDERAAALHPDKALFLCWPPYGAGVASRALAAHGGEVVAYVGEWLGGAAEPDFFATLAADYVWVDGAPLPQWWMRDDRLWVFRRR